MSTIKHFETIWQEAENISSKKLETDNTSNIATEIADLCDNLSAVDEMNADPSAKSSLKKRYIGEILFHLTAISAKENINVYAVLKEQILLNQEIKQ